MPQSGHVSFVSQSRDFSFMNVLGVFILYIIRYVKSLMHKIITNISQERSSGF
jgi:hypothetical protein